MVDEALYSPRATYRLQFHAGFTFADAGRIVPYLDKLGISHVYASPFLEARTGSTHGYDITDHNRLNHEVGDEASFDAFCRTLARHGMGQILDFVPNHMGVGRADNRWWLDVLEWGEESLYAGYFDIDWQTLKPELRGKVLLPFLGDHYGRVLLDGALKLTFDDRNGTFGVWYYEHLFPIHPGTYPVILRPALDRLMPDDDIDRHALAELSHVVSGFAQLRGSGRSKRRQSVRRTLADRLKRQLAELARTVPQVPAAIRERVDAVNGTPGVPASLRGLHDLLEKQSYRLAYWRVAAEEINYRRFFQINDLAGLRMEIPEVFDAVHGFVLRLIAEGRIHGLRIDHIDGLFEPQRYLERLQTRIREARSSPSADADRDFYIVVEKILAAHESLDEAWPIAGTTGYEFLNRLNGLFVEARNDAAMTRAYERFCGKGPPFAEIAYVGRKLAMDQELVSELRVLANEINHLTETNWLTRDYTLVGLRQALREIVASFPVYRTYVGRHGARPEDRRDIDWAVAHGRRRSTRADLSVFDFLNELLTTDVGRKKPLPLNRREVQRLAMKFQQYTGAVMAKGLEDTAFYRYNRLVSLNEVGGEPTRFGTTRSAFHRACQDVTRRWPHMMLTTATHDTKRGEDVRARINVLSELPDVWGREVRRWSMLNKRHRRMVNDAPAPSSSDEYLFYQTLVGAWPAGVVGSPRPPADAMEDFARRVADYMLKAAREAKVHTSWVNADAAYEDALNGFVVRSLDAHRRNIFLEAFQPFAERVARLGAVNSLAQTAIKLTAPGVPDLYQGCELWDLNLVDPDNRRPVDFPVRADMLTSLKREFDGNREPAALGRLLAEWPTGRVKLFEVWTLLALRRRLPRLFAEGTYVPASAEGDGARHVLAFLRACGEDVVLTVVPRLLARRLPEAWPSEEGVETWCKGWRDTRITIDLPTGTRALRNVFSGEVLDDRGEVPDNGTKTLPVRRLLAEFPVGVFVNDAPTEA